MRIYSIGISALAAAQAGISTTGHNIANASTEGYSRQKTVQTSAEAKSTGSGYIGQGVSVTTVKRIYDETLAKQINSTQSSSNASSTYSTNIKSIDTSLSSSDSGLTTSMSAFFSSLSKLASNSSDSATRSTTIATANSLANTFQSLGTQLSNKQTEVNTGITDSVSSINSLTSQIATLNDSITKASASGQEPNDLLDQRDQAITNLSKLVSTTVSKDGTNYNVSIGNGIPLVVGVTSNALSATTSDSDPTRTVVAYTFSNSKVVELGTNTVTGGSLGGLLSFREQSLDTAQNQLGQIATVFADTFNTQHKSGLDINGDAGTDFFSVSDPVSYANRKNTGSATLSASLTTSSALTSSNYSVSYDGSNYNITRLSDKTVVSSSTMPQTVDGLTFSISGSMSSGDSFLVKPTANTASSFTVEISDVNKIAAAAGTTTGSSIEGDGTNAQKLNDLQNKTLIKNSTSSTNTVSYSTAYNKLVSSIATKANEQSTIAASDAKILAQQVSDQQSISGVNLDEEAANLIKYQQLYEAASKLMTTAGKMFDTLLSIS